MSFQSLNISPYNTTILSLSNTGCHLRSPASASSHNRASPWSDPGCRLLSGTVLFPRRRPSTRWVCRRRARFGASSRSISGPCKVPCGSANGTFGGNWNQERTSVIVYQSTVDWASQHPFRHLQGQHISWLSNPKRFSKYNIQHALLSSPPPPKFSLFNSIVLYVWPWTRTMIAINGEWQGLDTIRFDSVYQGRCVINWIGQLTLKCTRQSQD